MSKDGVIPLRHFFDRDVNSTAKTGQNIADEILRIISVESGAKPFRDMQISEMLAARQKQNANTKSKPSTAGSIWKRRRSGASAKTKLRAQRSGSQFKRNAKTDSKPSTAGSSRKGKTTQTKADLKPSETGSSRKGGARERRRRIRRLKMSCRILSGADFAPTWWCK